jgi:hypothetical protein
LRKWQGAQGKKDYKSDKVASFNTLGTNFPLDESDLKKN